MSAAPPLGGARFIADTSAWSKARQLDPDNDFEAAVRNGQIGTCAAVNIELFAGTQNPAAFERWEQALGSLHEYPSDLDVWEAAVGALRDLASIPPHGLQRKISTTDAVVAATAAAHNVGVIHYDDHYDRLEQVLDFESHWLRPRGTLK